jgi:Protein of unknown function (DUF669)
MDFKFTPKDEKQLAEENILPEGVYDFEVIGAEAKISKSGNPMMVVDLCIFDDNGKKRFIKDYLLESFLPKLLAFCKETGLRGAYDAGTLSPDDLEGKSGKVELKIEQQGDFPAKNVVKWYGVKAAKGAAKAKTTPAPSSFKPSAPAPDLADEDLPY